MANNTRVYEDKVSINCNSVKDFWGNRAQIEGLKSVLLGNQKDAIHNDLRNADELSLLRKLVGGSFREYSILDIGCGIGRWAQNLKDEVRLYHGIDYCDELY